MKFIYFIIGTIFTASALLMYLGRTHQGDNDGFLVIQPDPTNDSVVTFILSGPIHPPMFNNLSRAYAEWRSKAETIIIELDSPGGSVDEGDRIITLIKKMNRSHRVRTYVGPDGECLSMCVPIYLHGELRIASVSSTWMFHEPSAVDKFTGKQTFVYEFESRQSSQDSFLRYFKRSDMDPEWRENLRVKLRLGDVWKTGGELKEERSNIVMVVE